MKISYRWLREFLNFDMAPEELAKHLLMLGFEVSDITAFGPGFEGIVVGEILEVGRHPNADRLSLCSVRVGSETLSIVCGAKNVAVGARVPVARIGAKLPGGRVIERAKIRGTESQGMICSAPELGVSGHNGDGVWILGPDAPIGADATELVGEQDHVLEIEVTPNRPDCLSHLGIARELSIYFHTPLKALPIPNSIPSENGTSRAVAVEAKDLCRRYLGRELHGLRVGSSPGWIARRLEAVGLRPINAVVDVTNYVLFELGHPLHAFDLDALQGDHIHVRRAAAGGKLRALDGKDYALAAEDLVIADALGPVAIAGIMGGMQSGVTEKTTRVYLEAAHFEPGAVRRASRRLGLKSDSSFRFERGCDPEAAAMASVRAADLILRLCGGTARAPIDVYAEPEDRSPIAVSAARINQILGSAYAPDRIDAVLKNLSARIAPHPDGMAFYAPSYRRDLATPWDLAEEVARHLGYDRIPSEAGPVKLQRPKSVPLVEATQELRRRLQAAGFWEAYNVDFIPESWLRRLDPAQAAAAVRVLNPLSEDQAFLRPTLLPGLLQNAAYNLSRGAKGLRLFEVGRVYLKNGSDWVERSSIAGIWLGVSPEELHWSSGAKASEESAYFYRMKGLMENLLGPLGPRQTTPSGDFLFHPGASAQLEVSGAMAGVFGLLHPSFLGSMGVEAKTAAGFVLDLDRLAEMPSLETKFKTFSQFPTVVRDLSIVLDQAVEYARVRDCVQGLEHLRFLDLVDVYAGKGIQPGRKSLTLRLTFGSSERTLRDEEVQAAVDAALARLAASCGAVLRA